MALPLWLECIDSRAAPPGGVPVLEAVSDQLSFGQLIEPSQLPAAVPAGVKRREALVASLQLRRETHNTVRTARLQLTSGDPPGGTGALLFIHTGPDPMERR